MLYYLKSIKNDFIEIIYNKDRSQNLCFIFVLTLFLSVPFAGTIGFCYGLKEHHSTIPIVNCYQTVYSFENNNTYEMYLKEDDSIYEFNLKFNKKVEYEIGIYEYRSECGCLIKGDGICNSNVVSFNRYDLSYVMNTTKLYHEEGDSFNFLVDAVCNTDNNAITCPSQKNNILTRVMYIKFFSNNFKLNIATSIIPIFKYEQKILTSKVCECSDELPCTVGTCNIFCKLSIILSSIISFDILFYIFDLIITDSILRLLGCDKIDHEILETKNFPLEILLLKILIIPIIMIIEIINPIFTFYNRSKKNGEYETIS